MRKKIPAFIKNLYNFYRSDLTVKDLEKLVKQDVPGLYDFYVSKMEKPGKTKNKFHDLFLFIKNLIIEFLEQLTPIRRLIFTLSIIIFGMSHLNSDWQWASVAFFMLCMLIAFELADKLTAKNELDVAREIQRSLMPKEAPFNNFYEISCVTENAKEVGGDYFDFIKLLDSEKIFVVIGDVSGKGMAAAIHMVQVQTTLHHSVYEHESPREILYDLNKNLKRILKNGTFFTACISSINPDGSILFSRAGHLPLLYYKSKENEFKNITPKGIGIGLAGEGLFAKTLEEICIKPDEGDILILYTDGVIEARNLYHQEFGEERLKSIVRLNKDKSAEEIKEIIVTNISRFRENIPPHDDLTIVILKTKPDLYQDLLP